MMRISSEVVAASLEVEGVGVGGAVATAEESIFELRCGSVFSDFLKKVTRPSIFTSD